ncbi:MAG: hypothetical protein OEV92_04100 [Nitrospinota bacterium]|nr:hypothetical protein [Nitrospinota bacterium]
MIENIRLPKAAWMAIHLALILLISWMLAGLINSFVLSMAGSASSGQDARTSQDNPTTGFEPPSSYTDILRKNIFNSASVYDPAEPSSMAAMGDGTGAPRTSLNLKLMGTLIWGSMKLAVIQLSPGSEKTFKLREFAAGAEIVDIERNMVTLLNNGRLERLELEFENPASSSMAAPRALAMPGSDVNRTGDGAIVTKGYLEAQLKNMNQLLTQVRAVPNMGEGGVTNGFKLFAIQSGSIFEKIGLANQDVVQRINGIELNSAEKGLELFQALRNETSFNVDIMRGSQKTTLRFAVQ